MTMENTSECHHVCPNSDENIYLQVVVVIIKSYYSNIHGKYSFQLFIVNIMTGFLESAQPLVGTAQGQIQGIRRWQNNTEELAQMCLQKLKCVLMQNVQVFTFYESFLRCTKNFNTHFRKCRIIFISFFSYAVDCEWNDWVLGDCSQSCGGGTRTDTRTKNVTEEHGGECDQIAEMEESCNVQECPGKLS